MQFLVNTKRILTFLPLSVLLTLIVVAGLSFSAWQAVWLGCLAALTYFRPAWGVSLLFLVISVDQVALQPGGVFVNFSEFEFGAAFLAWTAAIWTKPARFRCCDWRPLLWGGAFCGAVVLSGLVHNEWYRVIPHTLRTAGVVLACFLAVNAFRSRPVHTLAGWLLALATLFYCSFGLAQFPTVYAGRVSSLFTNPNQFAGYLNLLFPFVLLMFFSSGGRRVRFLWAFLTLALLVMLVTTQSRSGLGAALITAGFLWWLYYREKLADFWRAPGLSARSFLRRSALSLAVGLLALCVVSLFVASIPEFRGKLSEAGEALQRRSWRGVWGSIENARLPFLRIGVEMWKDNWLLGVGPGNHGRLVRGKYRPLVERYEYLGYYEEFRSTVAIHVHNLYLQLAVSVGLVGLSCFLYLMLRLMKAFLSAHRQGVLPLAGFGLLTSLLIHNLMDVTFPSLGLEAGLLLGLALAGTGLGEAIDSDHPVDNNVDHPAILSTKWCRVELEVPSFPGVESSRQKSSK